MNTGSFNGFRHAVPIVLLALAGQASAHPGDHGAGSEAAGFSDSVWHFLTSIDHIGPVIAVGAVAWALWRWSKRAKRS